MTRSALAFSTVVDHTQPDIEPSLSMRHDEEIRAVRALGVLLESRLIDQAEYDRRVATYTQTGMAN